MSIDDDFAPLVAAMKPVFDKQRETWEREGPAAKSAFEATGATLKWLGGNCPVQGEGEVDGQAFYFRARGGEWEFHVAPTDAEIYNNDTFWIERDYGDGPFDAGWMPEHEALGFIVVAIGEFRAAQAIEARSGETERLDPKGESAVAKPCARTEPCSDWTPDTDKAPK